RGVEGLVTGRSVGRSASFWPPHGSTPQWRPERRRPPYRTGIAPAPGGSGLGLAEFGGFRWQQAVGAEHGLDAADGLADAVLVLDQGKAHMVVAVLAEADARGDRHLGLGQQFLGELQRPQVRI